MSAAAALAGVTAAFETGLVNCMNALNKAIAQFADILTTDAEYIDAAIFSVQSFNFGGGIAKDKVTISYNIAFSKK